MGKWIARIFLARYQAGNPEIFKQAKSLTGILLGLAAIIVAMLFITITSSSVPLMVILVAFIIGLLLLVRTGHQHLSGIILTVLLSGIIPVFVFLGPFTEKLEPYQMAFLEIFLLFITLLITSKYIHSIIIIGSSTLGLALEYFFRALPAQAHGKLLQADDYILPAILVIFAGILVMSVNKRSHGLKKIIEEEALASKKRAGSLEQIVRDLQKDFDTGEQLMQSAQQVFVFIDEIKSQGQSMRDEINRLTQGSTRLQAASTSIAAASDSVAQAVNTQTVLIEQSSSAITEMMSSLQSISGIAQERKSVIITLAGGTAQTGQAIQEATESIQSLKGSVTALAEINDAIKSLASQTGLLAMNAAIEAAHAGDKGKGFAVVAEEIRKLAEHSTENITIIANTLKKISAAINAAGDINQNALQAYLKINKDIETVIQGMDEILRGITELSAGTKEINTGTAQSVTSTAMVSAGVGQVNSRIQEIAAELAGQGKASSAVLNLVENILGKLSLVHAETSRVKSIGQVNADNLKVLGKKISAIGTV